MKIKQKIVDLETGQETISERDETADEIKELKLYETEQAKRAVLQAEADAAKAAATVKLAALGLTTDDLKALGL